ncbi:MAG: gluconate 2-dehydrogenase subunit 3 family protein [Thermoanaerobaculales bacterium]
MRQQDIQDRSGAHDSRELETNAGEGARSKSRRELFRYAFAGVAVVAGLAILKRVFLPSSLDEGGRETFVALLDTLLPATGLADWRTTGVMPRLVDELAARRQPRRALVEGVAWLDAQAHKQFGTSFAPLPVDAREAIVKAAEESEPGTLPHYFYRVVRDRAMQLHYAHVRVWRPLGMPHPPQPDGYLDFAEAPRG